MNNKEIKEKIKSHRQKSIELEELIRKLASPISPLAKWLSQEFDELIRLTDPLLYNTRYIIRFFKVDSNGNESLFSQLVSYKMKSSGKIRFSINTENIGQVISDHPGHFVIEFEEMPINADVTDEENVRAALASAAVNKTDTTDDNDI